MSRADELARQQVVLALLADDATAPAAARLRTDPATPRGVQAYQRNAQATARRVLRAHFPTVTAMVGEDTLDALALILWQCSPPSSGDLGEWGAALPDLLARHPDLQAWPWLADSARLDWARHLCERAADARLDAPSLQRLGDTPPEHLQLVLVPGLRLLKSPWPLVALWEAHHGTPTDTSCESADSAQAQAALAALLEAGGHKRDEPEAATTAMVIWRGPDWRIHMAAVDEAEHSWMRRLLDNTCQAGQAAPFATLSELLDQAPPDLDFGAWLGRAVSAGWLWRVAVLPRPPAA